MLGGSWSSSKESAMLHHPGSAVTQNRETKHWLHSFAFPVSAVASCPRDHSPGPSLCKSPLYSSHCLQHELHRPCRLTAELGPIEPHCPCWFLCWSKVSVQANSRTNNDELQPKKATKEQQFPNIEHTVHLVEAGIDYIGHASLDATNTTSFQHNFWPTFWPIRGRGTPWKADGHTAVT